MLSTLKIPDMERVKLDVYVTTKNSLDSKKNAKNAPSNIHKTLC